MKSLDIQISFEIKFRTLDVAGARKYFKTYEIENFLNEALFEYFSELVSVFEINEKARNALVTYTNRLIVSDYIGVDAPVGMSSNSHFFDISSIISDNHVKIVEGHFNDSLGNTIGVKPVSHDFYLSNIDNKYKKPYNELAWRMDISNNGTNFHEIIYNGIIVGYTITYVIRPNDISFENNTDILLSRNDIDTIIEIAVSKAARTIGSVNDKPVKK